MATGDGTNGILTEIAGLRMQMEVGFAKIEGQLNLLVHTQGQFREDLADVEQSLGDVERRVSALEARRWPMAPMAAMSGAMSAAIAGMALFIR